MGNRRPGGALHQHARRALSVAGQQQRRHAARSPRRPAAHGGAAMSNEFDFGPAPDAKEQLRRWDNGDSIWSIEMGGFGPGYEQALQICAIEIVRDNLGQPLPDEKTWSTWGDATVARI